MSRMSEIDQTIQDIKRWLKNHIEYIIVSIIIIIIAFLVHAQVGIDKKKLNNQIYDLNVQIKSLEETIDNLERGNK